jgi:hypothetical protein
MIPFGARDGLHIDCGRVAELVDAAGLKLAGRKTVWVRLPARPIHRPREAIAMARRRTTADERRQAAYEADARQWRVFQPKLAAASSMCQGFCYAIWGE